MHALTNHFTSLARWVRGSHTHLLIAGLAAIALISAALTFAAGPDPAKDEVSIEVPAAGAIEREDFPVEVTFKPKQGRQTFSTHVYLDGRLIDVRTQKGKKFDGKETVTYGFQYGSTRSGANAVTNARFDRQLLRPGEHEVKVVVRNGVQPGVAQSSEEVAAEASHRFTVDDVKSVTTAQEDPITIKAKDLAKSPVIDRSDTRIVREQAQAATGSLTSPDTIANGLGARNLLSPFVETAKAHQGDHGNIRLISAIDSNRSGSADARLGNVQFWVNKLNSKMNCHGYKLDDNNTLRITTPAGGANIGETLVRNCPTFLPTDGTFAGPGQLYRVRLIMPAGHEMVKINPIGLNGLVKDYQPNPTGQSGPYIDFHLPKNRTVEIRWVIGKIPPPPAPPAPPSLPGNVASCSNGAAPFYRLNKIAGTKGDHFYTLSASERNTAITSHGYKYEGVAGYLFPDQKPGTVPFYRLWSPTAIDHFYTTSAEWRDRAAANDGYVFEGIAGYLYPNQAANTAPLYRSYSHGAADYFYTMSAAERDSAAKSGWGYQDVAGFMFTSCPPAPEPEPQAPPDSDGDGVPDDKDACPNEPKGPDGTADGCPKLTSFDPNAPFLALTKVSATEAEVDAFALEFDGTRPNGAIDTLTATVDGTVTDTVKVDEQPANVSDEEAASKDLESATIRNQSLKIGNVEDGKAHTVELAATTDNGNQETVTFEVEPTAAEIPTPPEDEEEAVEAPVPVPATGAVKAVTNAEDDFSALPKTGQAGLIAFLVFLLASATYYGTQFYRERKAKRS